MEYQELMKIEYLIALFAIILLAVIIYYKFTEYFESVSPSQEQVTVKITPIEASDAPVEISSNPVEEIRDDYIEGPPVTDSFYVPEPFDVASEMAPLMD